MNKILSDLWLTFTLLCGVMDERATEGMDDDQLAYSLLPLAIVGSLGMLVLLTFVVVTFNIG